MRNAIETIEHKGFNIEVYRDEGGRSPEDEGDDSIFLVGYHREFYVDRSRRIDGKRQGGISQELAQRIANKGRWEDGSKCSEAQDYIKRYHIFGLEAYIHSGVALALSHEGNFPDRQWDVSQLGLVFVSRKYWKRRDKARKAALGHDGTVKTG